MTQLVVAGSTAQAVPMHQLARRDTAGRTFDALRAVKFHAGLFERQSTQSRKPTYRRLRLCLPYLMLMNQHVRRKQALPMPDQALVITDEDDRWQSWSGIPGGAYRLGEMLTHALRPCARPRRVPARLALHQAVRLAQCLERTTVVELILHRSRQRKAEARADVRMWCLQRRLQRGQRSGKVSAQMLYQAMPRSASAHAGATASTPAGAASAARASRAAVAR
jgi:hypothetical protein